MMYKAWFSFAMTAYIRIKTAHDSVTLHITASVQWRHPGKYQQSCHSRRPTSPYCDWEAAAAVGAAWLRGQHQELHQLHHAFWGEASGSRQAGQKRSETKAPWISESLPCQTFSPGLILWNKWSRAASGWVQHRTIIAHAVAVICNVLFLLYKWTFV